jgi:hypothetical protein
MLQEAVPLGIYIHRRTQFGLKRAEAAVITVRQLPARCLDRMAA